MLPALIAAGASLAGGLLNRQSAKEANEANARQAAENIALQKQFAQEGIRWKVADAKAAGIHPLYALGAQTTSFAPVSVGAQADTSLGNSLATAGQDISRAINTTRTLPERVAAQQQTALQLEGLHLDNEIKRATIASSLQRISQNQSPPMPTIETDKPVGFAHPENPKAEQRPPLMLWGNRVLTPPGTSPMKAWEDQIGDDGPLSWLAQLAVGSHMIQHNVAARQGTWKPNFFTRGPNYDGRSYHERQR